jgi:signal peptidase I
MVWIDMLERPKWWLIVACIPVINVLIILTLITDTLISFGVYRMRDHVPAMMFPFIYLPYYGFMRNEEFLGSYKKRPEYKHNTYRSWVDAIVYAVVAAYILRAFSVEFFQIPTSSMEKTLLVGDFLIVSKFQYGARIPMTPLGIPFFHNVIPGTSTLSYLEWIQLPEIRFPKVSEIERNDIVVFNHAAGDTILASVTDYGWDAYGFDKTPNLGAMLYDDQIRQLKNEYKKHKPTLSNKQLYNLARNQVHNAFEIKVRPIDKRDHYVKRCVAISGDSIEVINGDIYINGQRGVDPEGLQFKYTLDGTPLTRKKLKDFGVNEYDLNNQNQVLVLTDTEVKRMENKDYILSKRLFKPNIGFLHIFPHQPKAIKWNRDNFGPLRVPAKGMTIELNGKNLALYKRCIEAYEGNKINVKGGKVYINDEHAETYTFKRNYYWMMGDNRHNSQDSRFWGFVPDNHIVGTPLMVLFSKDLNDWFYEIWKWRFDRVFKLAND